LQNLENLYKYAQDQVGHFESLCYKVGVLDDMPLEEYEGRFSADEELTKAYFESCIMTILCLLDHGKLVSLKARFQNAIAKKNNCPWDMIGEPDEGYFYFVSLFHKYLEVLGEYFELSLTKSGTKKLENFLRKTPMILKDINVIPRNEPEMNRHMLHIIQYFFDDATGNYKIPKGFQNFTPDIVIRSLKTLVEFKLAKEKKHLKQLIRGIYEDTIGYSDPYGLKFYYSVFYMKEHYMTENQIKTYIVDMPAYQGPNNKWTPIVVIGPTK